MLQSSVTYIFVTFGVMPLGQYSLNGRTAVVTAILAAMVEFLKEFLTNFVRIHNEIEKTAEIQNNHSIATVQVLTFKNQS